MVKLRGGKRTDMMPAALESDKTAKSTASKTTPSKDEPAAAPDATGVPTTALRENLKENLKAYLQETLKGSLQEDATMGASAAAADPFFTSTAREAAPSTGTAAPSQLQKNFAMLDEYTHGPCGGTARATSTDYGSGR